MLTIVSLPVSTAAAIAGRARRVDMKTTQPQRYLDCSVTLSQAKTFRLCVCVGGGGGGGGGDE